MNLDRKIELLDQQIGAAKMGNPDNFNLWRNETEVVLRTVMGPDSPQLKKFLAVRYSPSVWYSGMDTRGYQPAGVQSAITILQAAKREINLMREIEGVVEDASDDENALEKAQAQGRVFIVHGHDGERKHEVARLLRALTGVEPTILHEQPNGGTVLIEKFEQAASGVGYAVVLLTADDVGRAKHDTADRPRARQNVVFELGFFCGAFGRPRVAILMEDGVESPSDIQGLVYIALDSAGGWKNRLAAELDHAGITVDWTALRAC